MKDRFVIFSISLFCLTVIVTALTSMPSTQERASVAEEVDIKGHTIFVWHNCSSGYSVHIESECKNEKCSNR